MRAPPAARGGTLAVTPRSIAVLAGALVAASLHATVAAASPGPSPVGIVEPGTPTELIHPSHAGGGNVFSDSRGVRTRMPAQVASPSISSEILSPLAGPGWRFVGPAGGNVKDMAESPTRAGVLL